ncbi:MAG: hypothetical protein ABMA26_08890 [Limisphaerales bacterium]
MFVLSVVGLILFRDPEGSRLYASARKEWKTNAVVSIERRVVDKAWLEKEMAVVKAKLETEGEDQGGWFTSDLLVLKNGDWIAYAAKCSKEDARIHDIFVGRASDGKWYYSTFHFCIGMLDLRMEGRGESLEKFITAYSLREFDGRSDECLKKTWPTPKP